MADDSDYTVPCPCGEELHYLMDVEQPYTCRKPPAKSEPVTIDRDALIGAIAERLSWASMHWDLGNVDAHTAIADAVIAHLAAQPVTGTEPAKKTQWGVRYQTAKGSEVHTLSDRDLCNRFVENPPQWLRRKATDPYPMTIMSRIAASEWMEAPE